MSKARGMCRARLGTCQGFGNGMMARKGGSVLVENSVKREVEMKYPKNFLWGVSTAAAQIEGGAAEDGRSPSIWDTFAAAKKVMNAKYFPTACNSYHMFERDLNNLIALGVNSYRMSVSWSRVLPDGIGKLNQKGVDYYKNVFESLLRAGIQPNVTLYHWDLPQVLEDKGGWANRDCIEWFGEYAEKMFRLFSDIVPYWSTINEPIATYVGYAKGKFAPGYTDEKKGNQARHNILVAHGQGIRAFRAVAPQNSKIGIVIDVWKRYPKVLTQKNLEAVRDEDERNWKFYTDPVLGKGYSDYILSALGHEGTLMYIGQNDYARMQEKLDFFGLNIYNRVLVNKDRAAKKKLLQGGNIQDNSKGDYPKVVYDVVKMLREMYALKLPILITENGKANYVFEPRFGKAIQDNSRVNYLKNFLGWIEKAIDDGLNIGGYYAWSLMDNIEWSAGTMIKYGLLHTNFRSYKTTWKKSAYFYRDYIKTHKS